MNASQILRALRARMGLILLVFVATVATTAVVTVLMPRTYRATALLLVDPREEQTLGSGAATLSFSTPQERQSYLQTQLEILASRKVARRVVDALGPPDAKVREAFVADTGGEGAIEDWLVEQLLAHLKVETAQSNVIRASYAASDRHQAARVVNAFATAYMDTLLELRTGPTREAASWFDEQATNLRRDLDAAQAELTSFLQRHNLPAPDERYDWQGASLAALADQALRAREAAAQGAARERVARQALAEGGSPDRLAEVADHPLIQRLKADLVTGEARLRELATQFGANHPAYQRQSSQNERLREQLEAESARVLAGIELAARQSRQREAAAAGVVQAERARLLALRSAGDEVSVLRRNVESAARAYDLARQRAAAAQVESRARAASVVLLSPAAAPRLPSSPRVLINLAVAIAVGAMLAIAAAILLEFVDRRARSAADLLLAVDAPLLGVVGRWDPRPGLEPGGRRILLRGLLPRPRGET